MTVTSFPALSRTQLHELLDRQDTLVLAANQRLVRDCCIRYGQWLVAQGRHVWSTPRVNTVENWLGICANTLLSSPKASLQIPERVLSSNECLQVWQTVIEEHEAERPLLRMRESAQLAMTAYMLECRFSLPDRKQETSDEVLRYRLWRREFRRRCQQRQWLTNEEWHWQILRAQLSVDPVFACKHLVLLGFDDFSPLLLALLESAQQQGLPVHQILECENAAAEWQTRAPQFNDEVSCAIHWAQAEMKQGRRIALVVPDLQAQRDLLERELLKALHPEAARSPVPLTKGLYNISAGSKLIDQGIICSALCLLKLMGSPRNWLLNDVSYLLRSPYTGDYAHDYGLRAQVDARLRAAGNDQMPATRVLSYLQKQATTDTPLFVYQQWLQARATQRAQPAKRLPSEWVEQLHTLLRTSGWPGTRTLNSVEWQAQQRFTDHLHTIATSDDFLGTCRYSEILQALTNELQDSSFQPEANANAPIQVLGMLEISGLYFDAIWVLNARDDLLPAAPRPNPFIALATQREQHLPRASCEHEWRYVQQWSKRLRYSTDTLIWSVAEQQGEQILRASALLQSLPMRHSDTLARLEPFRRRLNLESVYETERVPVSAPAALRGGVDLLKAQSRNPLWAFAQFRLGARALDVLTPFTAPRVHGLIVHAALEAFWRDVKDSHLLKTMTDVQRQEKIGHAVHLAFNAIATQEETELPRQWCRIETQLVTQLLDECLRWEAEHREPFTVVALEQPGIWTHREWQLHTRIDRIDQLRDEREIVIDYKTGMIPSPTALQVRPLREPQLPLYALIRGEHVQALLFAQLRRGQFRLNGIAHDDDCNTKVILGENWHALRTQWRVEMEQLTDSLLDGCIENRFQHIRDLQYCPVLPFLRIHTDDEENVQ